MAVYLFGMVCSMILFRKLQIDHGLCNAKKLSVASYVAISLPLTIIAAIRYDVGTDYFNYVNYHIPSVLYGSSVKGSEYIEYGYAVLIKICIFLTHDVQSVFVVTAFLIVILFSAYIVEWSCDWAYSIALFVLCYAYNQSLNIMRQYVAISIFFFALKYIRDKNFFKYVICITIATLMHKTAIFYFPFYFIANHNLKERKKNLLGMVLLIYIFNKPIMSIMAIILSYLHMNNTYIKMIGSGEFSIILIALNLFVYLLSCAAKDTHDNNIESRIMFNIQAVGLAISAMLGIIPFGTRILYMFMPIQIVYIPYIIKKSRIKQKKILSTLVLIIYFLFYIYYVQIKNVGETLPYQTIFNK